MSDKYIIRNCPACYDYEGKYGCEDNHDEQGRDTYCECITDCVMKQIVDKCRKTVKIFSAESGTQPYAGGRCTEAEGILELLDIQEVE